MKKNKVRLFRYRWSIPVIGELAVLNGARFVTLLHRLGISRSVLTSTLRNLAMEGVVMSNPGHGHPLRPEYILTDSGRGVSGFCREIAQLVKVHGNEYLIHSRWALPILFLAGEKGVRFSDFKSRLAPITARALSQELKQLHAAGFLERKVIADYPPTVLYSLTELSAQYTVIYEKYRKELCKYW